MKWNFELKLKNYIINYWFILKIIIFFLYKILGVGLKCISVVVGIELEINVISKNIYPLLFFLNKHTLCQFKIISDIICYDSLNKKFRFFMVYNLLSLTFNIRLCLITKINEFTTVLSTISLFKVANWLEREIFDFFGIFFLFNNDLRRILTDYGFKGFPLRKDFPLTGFIEMYYDDNQNRICCSQLELSQEYRNYKLKTLCKS